MSDLHSEIMNIQCPPNGPISHTKNLDAFYAYADGFRYARHAAAELASAHVAKLERKCDDMLDLLKAIQEGPEWTLEFCQRIDETIARIETK